MKKMLLFAAGMGSEEKQMQVLKETNAVAGQFGLRLTDADVREMPAEIDESACLV